MVSALQVASRQSFARTHRQAGKEKRKNCIKTTSDVGSSGGCDKERHVPLSRACRSVGDPLPSAAGRKDIVKKLCSLVFAGALACAALPAFAQNPFGAVVRGHISGGDPSWGLAWSVRGYDDAGERARNECYERGAAACLIVGYSRASCGALAVDAMNGHGAAWGESIDAAERTALSACRALGRTCRIAVSRCAG